MDRAFGRLGRLTVLLRHGAAAGAGAAGEGRGRAAGFAPRAAPWLAVLALAACSPDAPRSGGAPVAITGTVSGVSGHAAGHPEAGGGRWYPAADLARGEVLSYACRACHGLGAGEESPIGPSLAGVFGRRAASVQGFEYSAALRASDIVWTPAALDAWLAEPNDFLPGNNMAFTGFRSAEDRRDLIAYLIEQTSAGAEP